MSLISRLSSVLRWAILACLALSMSVVGAPSETDRLSLWRMEQGGSKVYLLGSMHAMKEDMYPLPGPIMAAFNDSEVIVFEADLGRLTPDEIASIIRQKGTYTPPSSISADLSDETTHLLVDYLRESRISFDQVRYLKPWNLALNIGIIELTRLGYKTEFGVDQYLQQRARQEGKEIRELESFGEQIEILSNDPIAIQDLTLRETLRSRSTIREELDAMVVAWRHGNADLMYRLAVASMSTNPLLAGQMDKLVTTRNHKMVARIRSYLGQGRDFLVVVGALHMGGPDGIIHELSRDYEVVQLSR
ncbi:MAG: TraB/GumN family protein [Proteobacteria bacterium]|nr:TraB/GumN family protein [Pseudomonadota bacterium]